MTTTSQSSKDGFRRQNSETSDERMPQRFLRRPWIEPLGETIPFHKIIAAFGGNVLKYKPTLLRAGATFLVAATISSLIPLATKFIIDHLFPSRNFQLLWITALVVLAVFLLRSRRLS